MNTLTSRWHSKAMKLQHRRSIVNTLSVRCSGARGAGGGWGGGGRVSRLSAVRFRSHHFRVSLTGFSSSWHDALLTPVPFRPRDACDDDDGDGWKMEKLSASINGLSWSSVSLPLDVIVSKFRLPTLVRLSHGKKPSELLNVVRNRGATKLNRRSCGSLTLSIFLRDSSQVSGIRNITFHWHINEL